MIVKPETGRLKYFVLPESVLVGVLTGRVKISDIPEGCTYVGCQFDFLRNGFIIAVEHPSFDEVEEGQMMPQFWPLIELIEPELVEA